MRGQRVLGGLVVAGVATLTGSVFGSPLDPETDKLARQVAAEAINYLRSTQHETGGWSVSPGAPVFPAITGLVVNGMIMEPSIDASDPSIARGVEFMLGYVKDDGGIHDNLLPSYNTAICISALSRITTPDAAQAVQGGVGAIRRMQWSSDQDSGPAGEPVDASHPFFGGVGYGGNSRPDMSNMGFFLQAMHDAGVSSDDPAFQRALVFLSRTQMVDEVNDMPYADGSTQGGFVYATTPNGESVDGFPGQSQAGEMIETLSDGTEASRLRAYGSMTYVGFKSLIYADLPPDDVRVVNAKRWLASNFTLAENPGMGNDGFYYYLTMMGRALDASGLNTLDTPEGERDWRRELIVALDAAQQPDGSFDIRSSRWMEDNPVLITAYCLIAVQHARGLD